MSSSSLRYYQYKTFIVCFIAFVAFTLTKRSLGFAAAAAIEAGELSATRVGSLASLLSLAYAIAKFFGGMACDRFAPVYLMAIGLSVCATANMLVGFYSERAALVSAAWIANGVCQSPAWPPIALMLTNWFHESERAAWWSVMTSAQTVGGSFTAFFITTAIVRGGSWQSAMIGAGVAALLVAVSLVPLLHFHPSALGLDPHKTSERTKGKRASAAKSARKLPLSDVLAIVFRSKSVLCYALASMCLYFVKEMFATWFQTMMVDARGLSASDPALGGYMFAYEVAGIPGCIFSAIVSARFFANGRSTTATAFVALILAGGVLLSSAGAHSEWWLYSSAMALVGFGVNGVQTMVGLGYIEENDKRCAGTIAGVVGSASYFGATIGGYPMALLTNRVGFEDGFFKPVLTSTVLIAAFLMMVPAIKKKKVD